MGKLLVNESFIKGAFLLTIGLLLSISIAYYNFHKQPWQVEAEQLVRSNLPVGTSRSRFDRWVRAKYYYVRDSDEINTETLCIWADKLHNKPNAFYDAVAVDIYFSPTGKITGYGSARGARVIMP